MSMGMEGLESLAPAVTAAALNAMWQGAAVTALAWVILKSFSRASAATLYAAWLVTLLAVVSLAALASPPVSGRAPVELPAGWPVMLFWAWVLGAAMILLRLLWSYGYIAWLARTCSPVTPELRQRAARLTGSRSVHICASRETPVPVAIGLRRPAIVLPQGLLERLSPEELDQIVLHEWAHIRRRDQWSNLAVELVKALFFFHPAVWFIARRLRLEREIACDDAVVSMTGAPLAYAGCLARLAELNAEAPALASGAVSGDLFRRVERLAGRPDRAGFSGLRFASAAAALVVAVLGCRQLPALVDARPRVEFVLAAPRPAIEASRQAILAEVRLRTADILMQAAEQRLDAANRALRAADREMRLAALGSGAVPAPRVACRQVVGGVVVIKLNQI